MLSSELRFFDVEGGIFVEDTSIFLRACRGERTASTPVWYMRQAGRYDPDYRKIKEKYSLLEICRQPELAAEITMMPIQKLGVDAAILYSDIMNPVAPMGIQFDIVSNIGPVIDNPIRSYADVLALRPLVAEEGLPHILQTIKLLRKKLNVPLIGFAGAPFTIASYLVEGRPSRTYAKTKQMMYREPATWALLMEKLGDMVVSYLDAQIRAGAQAVQVFDSWVGALSVPDFEKYVLPTIERIFSKLQALQAMKPSATRAPLIYFPGINSGELLRSLDQVQADVIGIDWRTPISQARTRLAGGVKHRAIQGNLDPYALFAPKDQLEQMAAEIIRAGTEQPGYIFNLGHGLFPEAPMETLKELTQFVQQYSRSNAMEMMKGLRT